MKAIAMMKDWTCLMGFLMLMLTVSAFASDAPAYKSQDQVLIKSGEGYQIASVLSANGDGTIAVKLSRGGYVLQQPVKSVRPLRSVRELTIPIWNGLRSRTFKVGETVQTKCSGKRFTAEIRDLTSDGLAFIVLHGLHWQVQHACDGYVEASSLN